MLLINKIALANFLPQYIIFCPIEMKFVADKLIMKQALPVFASAWLPPWPVRRACKSMREIVDKLKSDL